MEDRPPASSPTAPAPGGGLSWDSGGPLKVAGVLVGLVAIGVPLALGIPSLSFAGLAILIGLWVRTRMRDHDHGTRFVNHTVYGIAFVAVSYAVFGLALPSVISVYFASIVLLNAAHLAGTRAAATWAIPWMGLVAASYFFAPAVEREVSAWATVGVRLATVAAIMGFGLSFRRAYDRQSEELVHLATTDPLTGLANRATLSRKLDEAMMRASRYERMGAVVFIDLDGLKAVNDRDGHDAGDELIRNAAWRMRSITRSTDTAARMGGDEFVLLLAEIAEPKAAEAVARKLFVALTSPFTAQGRVFTPRASLGVAVFPQSADTGAALLAVADDAMYEAKRAGGNRIVVDGPGGLQMVDPTDEDAAKGA